MVHTHNEPPPPNKIEINKIVMFCTCIVIKFAQTQKEMLHATLMSAQTTRQKQAHH